MVIAAGSALPHAKFKIMTETGPSEVSTEELFKGKKAVLFAVPGAFTPTCHGMHLPGFLRHAAEFKAKGVDLIACTSVNDVFVMDGTPIGFGIRSKRYAMLLEDGVVKALHVENKPSSAEESSAERLLSDL